MAWSSDSTPASASTAPAAAAAARSIAEATAQAASGCPAAAGEGSEASSTAAGSKSADDAGSASKTHACSIVSELFQGHVVSTVRCLECQRCSRTKEPIYDVSVQIPNPNESLNGQALPPEVAAAQAAA